MQFGVQSWAVCVAQMLIRSLLLLLSIILLARFSFGQVQVKWTAAADENGEVEGMLPLSQRYRKALRDLCQKLSGPADELTPEMMLRKKSLNSKCKALAMADKQASASDSGSGSVLAHIRNYFKGGLLSTLKKVGIMYVSVFVALAVSVRYFDLPMPGYMKRVVEAIESKCGFDLSKKNQNRGNGRIGAGAGIGRR